MRVAGSFTSASQCSLQGLQLVPSLRLLLGKDMGTALFRYHRTSTRQVHSGFRV